jgi:hypothetical protein
MCGRYARRSDTQRMLTVLPHAEWKDIDLKVAEWRYLIT